MCMILYKPIDDVTLTHNIFAEAKRKDWAQVIEDNYGKSDDTWSDKKDHHKINITGLDLASRKHGRERSNAHGKKSRSWARYHKRLVNNFKFQTLYDYAGNVYDRYLPVEIIAEYDGWFLKKAFYKREYSEVFLTSEKQIRDFLKRYGKTSEYKTYQNILNQFKDGMILEVSW